MYIRSIKNEVFSAEGVPLVHLGSRARERLEVGGYGYEELCEDAAWYSAGEAEGAQVSD
jgi:hypothetical protein